jgi:alpha-galactosidase
MKWLAGRLTKMGFEPGLWFAPGILEPHARISQWDSEMLARGECDLPCLGFSCMERKGMILDPTHPRSQAWLEELFERYVDMGYRYFKLDFLAMTLNARRFHDNTIPRGDVIGKLVEPIRRVTKGRAKILGCNYPFNAGTDLVDTVRTSGDIHALWWAIKDNVFSIAGRFWSHNRLWVNDPDFALCRGLETSDDPDLQRLKCCHGMIRPEDLTPRHGADLVLADINEDEVKTLMALVIISGGVINLSDKMIRLNEKGLDIARRAVAATPGDAGIPLDLFSSVRPAYWLQHIPGGVRILLVNWSEIEVELCHDLVGEGITAMEGREFWTDEVIKLPGGVLQTVVKPHASLLVEIRQ